MVEPFEEIRKFTHEEVRYREPSYMKRCADCLFFLDDGCEFVDDEITPSGTCKIWFSKAWSDQFAAEREAIS
jgi:hypothetical protein